jgi:hypothetical protein
VVLEQGVEETPQEPGDDARGKQPVELDVMEAVVGRYYSSMMRCGCGFERERQAGRIGAKEQRNGAKQECRMSGWTCAP